MTHRKMSFVMSLIPRFELRRNLSRNPPSAVLGEFDIGIHTKFAGEVLNDDYKYPDVSIPLIYFPGIPILVCIVSYC